MQRSLRAVASATALAVALAACGGHSSIPTTVPNAGNTGGDQTALRTVSPMISVPHTFGKLAFTDLGRRAATAPVNVAVVMRYNHQNQLDAFIASQSTPGAPHHYLTQAE